MSFPSVVFTILFSTFGKANLEYVSVFLDDKDNFQVNLWYVGNKHYKMYVFEKKETAMKFGKHVAAKLNIDLLDATERGKNIWIEKT